MLAFWGPLFEKLHLRAFQAPIILPSFCLGALPTWRANTTDLTLAIFCLSACWVWLEIKELGQGKPQFLVFGYIYQGAILLRFVGTVQWVIFLVVSL